MKAGIASFYDPATDKVFGCEEFTLVWYHERRHQLQFKAGVSQYCQMISYWCIVGAIAFLVGDEHYLAFLCLWGIILPWLFLEVDAWIYAIASYAGRSRV